MSLPPRPVIPPFPEKKEKLPSKAPVWQDFATINLNDRTSRVRTISSGATSYRSLSPPSGSDGGSGGKGGGGGRGSSDSSSSSSFSLSSEDSDSDSDSDSESDLNSDSSDSDRKKRRKKRDAKDKKKRKGKKSKKSKKKDSTFRWKRFDFAFNKENHLKGFENWELWKNVLDFVFEKNGQRNNGRNNNGNRSGNNGNNGTAITRIASSSVS
ncbi:hypothetical protein DL771_000060 [Monosporascus sp. 5C6A]|nr:hypothetical protein DL771_000060 [Monosporascus sp. 5C6A]